MIQTPADMAESASHCLPLLLKLAPAYDGFLAACYADHPLVRQLQIHIKDKPVVGIFDASIYAALQLLGPRSRFGIVTTGPAYEALLSHSVGDILGKGKPELDRFAGVSASGIGMTDMRQPLNQRSQARKKIKTATTRLLRVKGDGDVDVVCMGGVILAGMEGWVHEACQEELGRDRACSVKVIDQLAAGMVILDALLEGRPLLSVNFQQALK